MTTQFNGVTLEDILNSPYILHRVLIEMLNEKVTNSNTTQKKAEVAEVIKNIRGN